MTSTVHIDVDLRNKHCPVRDQGQRNTCLACATSDAHAMHHACEPLSAEFLYYHAIQIAAVGSLVDGLTFPEAAAALNRNGQPAETDWPYSIIQPHPWTPPLVSKIWRAALIHDPAAAAAGVVALVHTQKAVVLGIRLSAAFLAPTIPNFIITADGDGFGGHAVLVVGLGHDAGGKMYFLIRNSWGVDWGDGGYAWLESDYLLSKFIGYASIAPQP